MATGGKIDAYLDCNSPYSFFAYTYLRRNRQALAEHGVTVEFHPIFLGGLNVGSGNKPPFTLPAKAKYGSFDSPRAQKYFGIQNLRTPSCFPIMSLLPMRSMLYIKDNYSNDLFEEQFGELWAALWQRDQDISKPEIMVECLACHFGEKDVQKILKAATDPYYKKLLVDETAQLVEKGAYGAPWYQVTNKHGKVEPFFGSDRFHFMYQYLEVPFSDIKILPPSSAKL